MMSKEEFNEPGKDHQDLEKGVEESLSQAETCERELGEPAASKMSRKITKTAAGGQTLADEWVTK